MKRLVMFALLLAACGEEADEMFPINPGGGGGTGGTSRRDAAVGDGGDGGGLITGRVCIIGENLRQLTNTCASTGGDALTVTLGTSMATPSPDGTFTIMRPPITPDLHWLVTGGDIAPSLLKYGTTFGTGTTPLVPAFVAVAFADMAAQNSVAIGTSSLVVRVTNGAPVPGATVDAGSDALVLYDGEDDATWETDATGTYGAAWVPNIAGATAQVIVTANGTPKTFADVQLVANAVTFVAAGIP
jgi:hypothetical protein